MKDSWEQGPVSRTWAAGSELLATNLSPTVSWPHDLDRSVNFSGSFSRCVARNPRLTSNYARIVLESRLGGRVGSLAVKHFTVAVAVLSAHLASFRAVMENLKRYGVLRTVSRLLPFSTGKGPPGPSNPLSPTSAEFHWLRMLESPHPAPAGAWSPHVAMPTGDLLSRGVLCFVSELPLAPV